MTTADPTAPDRPRYGVGPIEAYTRFWRRYAVFSGRASRSEYWWFALLNGVVLFAVGLLIAILIGVGSGLRDEADGAAVILTSLGGVVAFILFAYVVAAIVPNIALAIRRLHDADLSGWCYLLTLIPYVGSLILLIMHLLPSNPSGRRFDRGATAWAPSAAWSPPPPASITASRVVPTAQPVGRSIGAFADWPDPAGMAAQGPSTATSPMPAVAEPEPEPTDPRAALRSAWTAVGAVEDLHPKLSSQPSWRRQSYLRIARPDGVGVLTTQGLSDAEGAAALGPGAEVYLGSTRLVDVPLERADGWELAVVAAVARRIGASGMNLTSELEQYGALSMNLAITDAPEGWAGAGGTVGVLLGLQYDDVPDTVATPRGEVRLVGMAMLHQEELARIVAGGGPARAEIAARLAQLPVTELVSPDRPVV